jgi:hypothetical protein
VWWDIGKHLRIEIQATQKLQPVEQPVRRRGIIADLKLAKPDEPADIGIKQFCQQPIKPFACTGIEPVRNPRLNPPFGGDQRVRTQPLDCRYRRQDRQGFTTTRDQTLSKIFVRAGIFSLIEKPVPQIASSATRKSLVTVGLAQSLHMLLAGLTPGGIGEKRVCRDTELSSNERQDFLRDHLARSQSAPWIA